MRDSIIYATIRSFFVAVFSIIGIFVGLIPAILLLVWAVSSSEKEPENYYSYEIVPNADGSRKVLSSDAPVVLKININGIIGLNDLTGSSFRQLLVESREGDLKNDRVKALLLHINTPGGTLVDANGIYHALEAYKERYKVPVYAFVDGLCASGGMYVACAADKIFANDVSLIGSVGVILPSFLNFTETMDKVGVKALTLFAGKGKDDMDPLRPWKPGEEVNLQSITNYYYEHFVNLVSKSRPAIEREKLVEQYGAKVFPAEEAQKYGYIDAGNYTYNQALKELVKKIGIEDQYYQVVQLENKSWFSSLFKGEFDLLKGHITHQIQMTPLDAKMQNQVLYLYQP